jgi:hypothetical protein
MELILFTILVLSVHFCWFWVQVANMFSMVKFKIKQSYDYDIGKKCRGHCVTCKNCVKNCRFSFSSLTFLLTQLLLQITKSSIFISFFVHFMFFKCFCFIWICFFSLFLYSDLLFFLSPHGNGGCGKHESTSNLFQLIDQCNLNLKFEHSVSFL